MLKSRDVETEGGCWHQIQRIPGSCPRRPCHAGFHLVPNLNASPGTPGAHQPLILVYGSLAEWHTQHACSVTLSPQVRSPPRVLLSKHVKCQTSLPKGRLQWEVAALQDPMNLHNSASGLRLSFDETAGNLPRVFFTLGPRRLPRQ